MKYLVSLFVLLSPIAALSAEYAVNYEQSSVTFAGEHAGNTFKGTFGEWSVELSLDKSNLEASSFKASFQLNSAKTGDAMYDGTLPQKDWFHTDEHPEGNFTSRSISAEGVANEYKVEGDLTLRGTTHPVTFSFTLSPEGNAERGAASFDVDRLAYDIGKGSDAKAEWVSQNITITLDILAEPINQ